MVHGVFAMSVIFQVCMETVSCAQVVPHLGKVKIQTSLSLRVKFRKRSAILVNSLVTTTLPSYRTRSLILETGKASFTRVDSAGLSSDHWMLAILLNCWAAGSLYLLLWRPKSGSPNTLKSHPRRTF